MTKIQNNKPQIKQENTSTTSTTNTDLKSVQFNETTTQKIIEILNSSEINWEGLTNRNDDDDIKFIHRVFDKIIGLQQSNANINIKDKNNLNIIGKLFIHGVYENQFIEIKEKLYYLITNGLEIDGNIFCAILHYDNEYADQLIKNGYRLNPDSENDSRGILTSQFYYKKYPCDIILPKIIKIYEDNNLPIHTITHYYKDFLKKIVELDYIDTFTKLINENIFPQDFIASCDILDSEISIEMFNLIIKAGFNLNHDYFRLNLCSMEIFTIALNNYLTQETINKSLFQILQCKSSPGYSQKINLLINKGAKLLTNLGNNNFQNRDIFHSLFDYGKKTCNKYDSIILKYIFEKLIKDGDFDKYKTEITNSIIDCLKSNEFNDEASTNVISVLNSYGIRIDKLKEKILFQKIYTLETYEVKKYINANLKTPGFVNNINALIGAIIGESEELIEIIAKQIENIEDYGIEGYNALEMALKIRKPNIIKKVLKVGFPMKNKYLSYAARFGYISSTRTLLEEYPNFEPQLISNIIYNIDDIDRFEGEYYTRNELKKMLGEYLNEQKVNNLLN